MGEHNAAFSEAQLERPNWFGGRLLTADDLDLQQSYVRERARRHNRLLHGWGVVTGLEIGAGAGLSLTLSPGFALDEAGNEILVPNLTTIDVRQAGLTTPGAPHWLVIRWDEVPTGEVPAPWPDEPVVAASWQEAFEIQVLEEEPACSSAETARSATPWVVLASVSWDGDAAVTADPSVRRLLQPPGQP